jgi:RNA polymerase sigma-70 factor (sigma-E family)
LVAAEAGQLPPDRDAAITWLFHVHGARLVGFARLLVDSQSQAEDLVQDAFVGLWRQWGTLRDPEAAVAYLRSTVANGARRRQRGTKLLQRLASSTGRDEAPDPALAVIATDESRRMIEALLALPRRQREVLVLRYYFDQQEAQIADMLAISRGSVKQHASRGLARLQQLIEVPS